MPRAYRTRDWWARRLPPLVAAGLSDPEAGRRLGCGPDAVGKWRRRLGLPHTRAHPRQKEYHRKKLARQLSEAGWDSLTQSRHDPARLEATRRWGEPLSPGEAAVMALLSERPRTAAELTAALGLTVNSRGGSCQLIHRRLAALHRLGLVRWSRVEGGHGRKLWSAAGAAEESTPAGDFRPRTVREPTPKRLAV